MVTRPELLVTSLDPSRKLADVLGYDVKTCWMWVKVKSGKYDLRLMSSIPSGKHIGNGEILVEPDSPPFDRCGTYERIPAYTVTELAAMAEPGYVTTILQPDRAARELLHVITQKGYGESPQQAIANLTEWQESASPSSISQQP